MNIPLKKDPADLERPERAVFDILDALGIAYERHDHAPFFTVEDAKTYWDSLDATHCKNLFLRNHKGDKYYLVVIRHDVTLPIKDMEMHLKEGKLSFASDRRLIETLGITPGSVSPFGLIHASASPVVLYLDSALQKSERLSFHPNINTITLVVRKADFDTFLAWAGNPVRYIDIQSS